jgi:class 3 adenylate cyclase
MAAVDEATPQGPVPTRRTIVFVDIADYSGLIRRLGDLDTVRVLNGFYDHASAISHRFNGSILKQMGDSVLVVFSDAAEAMSFAGEIQLTAARKEGLLGSNGLKFRIGVHTGDVYTEMRSYGEDIFGIAVNIAADITAVAQPGQIVVSHSAMPGAPMDARLILKGTERHRARGSEDDIEINRLEVVV